MPGTLPELEYCHAAANGQGLTLYGGAPGVAQPVGGVPARIACYPQAVVGPGHGRPVGRADDGRAHVDERLGAVGGCHAVEPSLGPPHVGLRDAVRLPVEHGQHAFADPFFGLGDEPVGLRLRGVAEVGPGEVVDAPAHAHGLESGHAACRVAVGEPVAFGGFDEREVRPAVLGGLGAGRVRASLPVGHVHPGVGERRGRDGVHRKQGGGERGQSFSDVGHVLPLPMRRPSRPCRAAGVGCCVFGYGIR